MSERPKILDVFCCAGGAGVGYSRAGFDVYGIDNKPQPNYPFPIYIGDAIQALKSLVNGESINFTSPEGKSELLSIRDFKAAHGSPPCQFYSITKHSHSNLHPDLVEPTRQLFIQSKIPYVIENVPGAPLKNPLILCGTQFDLTAQDVDGVELELRRHRLFETNFDASKKRVCTHGLHRVGGVYTGSYHRKPEHRDNPNRKGGYTPEKRVKEELMGIDWMTEYELAQSLPPVYTEFIGNQILQLGVNNE